MSKTYGFCKRLFDIVAAGAGLVVLSPVMIVLAALVKLDSRGPAVFRQQRLGRNGIPFTVYKFRTMLHGSRPVRNPDGSYYVGNNDPRMTALGAVLREASLDELPQLINVLKGEMSIVGPRPDQVADLALYDNLLRTKLQVRPGLASLASIHGRNTLKWRKRAKWEAYYVHHCNWKLDALIIWRTAIVVVRRKGVYGPSQQPATPQSGTILS